MYIRVHVTPGARRERIERTSDTTYTMAVKEPAAHNRANARVRALLAQAVALPLRSVRLVTGHRSPVKMYAVELSAKA